MNLEFLSSDEPTELGDELVVALHAIFNLLDDDALREVARTAISSCAVHTFDSVAETADEHAKRIREVCRALERSAGP